MISETNKVVGHWTCFCDEEQRHDIDPLPLKEGLARDGVFLLSPTILEILIATGVLSSINEELGTHFDRAEEEVLPPVVGHRVGSFLRALAEERYGNRKGILSVRCGIWNGEPWIVSAETEHVHRAIMELAEFLCGMAAGGKTVVAFL